MAPPFDSYYKINIGATLYDFGMGTTYLLNFYNWVVYERLVGSTNLPGQAAPSSYFISNYVSPQQGSRSSYDGIPDTTFLTFTDTFTTSVPLRAGYEYLLLLWNSTYGAVSYQLTGLLAGMITWESYNPYVPQ